MLIAIFIVILIAILVIHGVYYSRLAEAVTPPVGHFTTSNNAKIHYMDLNSDAPGKPIVLIHGASCNLLDMKTSLGVLSENRRVILIDRPGFGYSARGRDCANLRMQARSVADLLCKLNVQDPVLIAQSFGTAVALSFALEFPDRASGLLLLAPVSHRWPGGVAWYNHVALVPVFGVLFRYCLIPLYGRLAGRGAIRAAFWPRTAPDGFYDRAGMALVFRPSTFKSNAEDLVALYAEVSEMEDRYQEIKIPVRMLAGTHDTVVLSTIHALSLEQNVKGASLRYLPGVGHPLHHAAFSDIQKELDLLEADIDQKLR